jgi:hypothetical protein
MCVVTKLKNTNNYFISPLFPIITISFPNGIGIPRAKRGMRQASKYESNKYFVSVFFKNNIHIGPKAVSKLIEAV